MRNKILLLSFIFLYANLSIAQSCNCDITLNGLSSSSVNLIFGNTLGYSPGDTICIPAGNYAGLRFYDLVGTATQPVTLVNCGGKVVLNESTYPGISFQRSSNVHITGSGDTSMDYGIEVAGTGTHAVGIYVENLSTDIEIDQIEVSSAGFAGIMAKTDPYCGNPATWRSNGFVLKNLNIHHNFIHDTGGEGIYIGFTGGYKVLSKRQCDGVNIFGHWLENVDVHHNIVENTGWDAIQLNLVRENGKIRDNYIYNYGLANAYYQNFAMSIGGGVYEVYNNFILNGPQKLGQGIQLISGESGTKIYNNVLIEPKFHGMFLHNRHEFDDINEGYYIANNTIIKPERAGVCYNTVITETNIPSKLYSTQDEVPSYFVNNLVVDPGYDFENGNTWKQDQESYFDFNNRSTRDSLLLNIYSNIMTRDMDTLGLADIANNDYSPASNLSDLYDAGSNVSTWGITVDLNNDARPSGNTYDIGAYEYRLPQEAFLTAKLPTFFSDEKAVLTTESTIFYPNPTDTSFRLENPEYKNPLLQIISMNGRILYQGIHNMKDAFNVEGYAPGLYFIKLISGKKTEVHKLVIQ